MLLLKTTTGTTKNPSSGSFTPLIAMTVAFPEKIASLGALRPRLESPVDGPMIVETPTERTLMDLLSSPTAPLIPVYHPCPL